MKITKETLSESIILLVEANHIVFATTKAAESLGLKPEDVEALPFTVDEIQTIAMATKLAHDILSELEESL